MLKRSHPEYNNIKNQFLGKWKKDGSPTLERIFEIKLADEIHENFDGYCEAVAKRDGRNGSANVLDRFHGTSSTCNVGVNVGQRPCSKAGCNVCGILNHGFQRKKAGTGQVGGWLRYGSGVYCSGTSGKANDYAKGSAIDYNGKTFRTMFRVKAAAGRSYKDRVGSLTTLKEPPLDPAKGGRFDSVMGETGKSGGALNYDELVVYEDSAIIPAYFLVYSV